MFRFDIVQFLAIWLFTPLLALSSETVGTSRVVILSGILFLLFQRDVSMCGIPYISAIFDVPRRFFGAADLFAVCCFFSSLGVIWRILPMF